MDSVGPRRRTAYRITDAGLAEVRRWLADGEVDHSFRLETLLRSFFFWLMEPEELKAHLAAERRYYEQYGQALRTYAGAKDCGEWGTSRETRAQRIAIEAAIRVNEALAGWAAWAEETDLMAAEDFGRAPAADGPADTGTGESPQD